MTKAFFTLDSLVVILILQSFLLLQGCSDNGFHLRKNIDLPMQYQSVQLENLPLENDFLEIFEETLEQAGGQINENASTKLVFSNFQQGKRVIAYTSQRKAREYLLFLKFDYTVNTLKKPNNKGLIKLPKRRVNIDRSYIYDPDFALGKAAEEKQVKKTLYKEAARLILFRLKYSQ